jgi:hypothetical protein
MMNTGALNQGNQYLSARGQDTSYDQSLMGMATNFANIQAQMAQSPLVAWYTARGLPPPQSALMPSNFQQTLAQTPQFQGLGQYQAPQLNWQFQNTQPGVGQLPTGTQAGPQYAPPSSPTPINFQNPTGGGYGSPNQALGAPQSYGQPQMGMQPTNYQVPPSPMGQMGAPPTMQTGAPPPNYDPSMSQGPVPWANSLSNGSAMPLYSGNNGGVNIASAQQFATMNPQEQQAAAQAAAMSGNPNYLQNVYNASPEWGGMAPGQYQGY